MSPQTFPKFKLTLRRGVSESAGIELVYIFNIVLFIYVQLLSGTRFSMETPISFDSELISSKVLGIL